MTIKQNHIYHLLIALSLVLLASSGGCRKETPPPPAASGETRPGKVRITVGPARLWVEVVENETTRTRGLMYRRQMPMDEGMLFVFEHPQQLSFWMKNTYLPLDIAFVAREGTILNILRMEPLNEGPRYNSRGQALYAIETNAGWFRKNGIKPGDKVRF